MDLSQTVNTNNLPPNSFFDIVYAKIGPFFSGLYRLVTDFFDPNYHVPYLGNTFKIVLAVLSTFFIFIISYTFIRMLEIRKKEHEHIHHEIHEYKEKHAALEKEKKDKSVFLNKKWEVVLNYIVSPNEGDWKLAVIEADSMLEELMDQLGFKGENLGEKLKGADQDKFKNLSIAWEVHLVRNRIAHEGSEFSLSQHEAKRIIAQYEQIFRNYGFI